jgi:hypothetical protein
MNFFRCLFAVYESSCYFSGLRSGTVPEPVLALPKPNSQSLVFKFRAVYSAAILNGGREGLARTIQLQYRAHPHPSLPEDLLAMVKLINVKLIGNPFRSCS